MDRNIKIGILGAGMEGLATAKYFVEHGYKNVLIFDQKVTGNFVNGVEVVGGADYVEQAKQCKIVFRSPGIKLSDLKSLELAGVKISSLTKYFFETCQCPIVGVSGTKGKGTTSTLIYLMLKAAGKDVFLGGNIGQPPTVFMDQLKSDSIAVMELSSFQLQDLEQSPKFAVMLNVSLDHLDYHKNIHEYWAAKSGLLRFQKNGDFAVLNSDYREYFDYYKLLGNGVKFEVSRKNICEAGAYIDGEKIIFARNGTMEVVAEIGVIALLGAHNLENVLPAVVIAKLNGVSNEIIRKVLSEFKGLPHRLELAREVDGVKYFNDSLSTNPDTSVTATKAFSQPVILIAGGSDKGLHYDEWAARMVLNKNVKLVILMGGIADKMAASLRLAEADFGEKRKAEGAESLQVLQANSFEDAFKLAQQSAKVGEIVLLSPAAASFDMFENYKKRGERFKELAMKIPNQ